MKVPNTKRRFVESGDYIFPNAFTGQPDRCTYCGKTWRVSQTDGSGNNVWQPGVFGWTEVVGA